VFTIGFLAYQGAAGAYFQPRVAVSAAPEGTLEGICHQAELTNAIIPLRHLEGGGEWLEEQQYSRPLGYTWMRASWPRHFDAFVFNREMQPSLRR
jgi:erythromycin esterase-like protein